MQPAVVELLTALAGILDRRGGWYLFGAQAAIAHGVPRLSADVDVTLLLEPFDPEGFTQEMRQSGFDPAVSDPDFIRRTRVIPFIHRSTGMPLDVVLAGSGLEEDFLSRVQRVDLGGVDVPLISAEDLIIAKVLAGRPKDIEDVRSLWRARGAELDHARIRQVLQLLEEALSQSDLLPMFDSITSSA
jgi:hypothetical protein